MFATRHDLNTNSQTPPRRRLVSWGLVAALTLLAADDARTAEPLASVGRDGQLAYRTDDRGNRPPDFSVCGYARGERDLPQASAVVVVTPIAGDNGARIQAALDYAGSLPVQANGLRGAVRLTPGVFEIAGQLCMLRDGVVLQGSGAGEGGTVLRATGTDRRAVIRIEGAGDPVVDGTREPLPIADAYVPVGGRTLTLAEEHGLGVGDRVLVTRPSTPQWIEQIGCNAFGVGWRPGSRDLIWDRTIAAVDGATVELDAPITTALDAALGGATVQKYDWPGRLHDVGVEDLTIEAEVPADKPLDEGHAWFGVALDRAEDCWIRRVRFRRLAGGAVALGRGSSRTTVVDCASLEPVSELGGYRRHTFFTLGQLGLFLRCWSEEGRHDFSAGHCAAGPNAFVNCRAARARDYSGPIESWAAGVLYDNVRIDGHDLRLQNNWSTPPGAGWSAANCVVWQCRAANVRCFAPPGAQNWASGAWADVAGDGAIESVSDFVRPQSLYQTQLAERVGPEAAGRVEPILGRSQAATNPTYEEAAAFVARSNQPATRLIDVIEENMSAAQAEIAPAKVSERESAGVRTLDEILASQQGGAAAKAAAEEPDDLHMARVENGWIVVDGSVKIGKRLSPSWWRGSLRADEAPAMGPAVTRFAPGRWGLGLTDDLDAVAHGMVAGGFAAYDHHYGLWYDRRRDDHLMVRRANGDVAPPFYEQPFARSGQGTAWDGLSKYDLTRFNPWYWSRLQGLAARCDERGLLLIHQNYFQHNILEAGAHWADCPWRPANNVNDTPLPEPPPYIGDKRLFMAHHFYDVAIPTLRKLHRGYIRQCLDALAERHNVIQMTSAEYSGPLEFVQFWLDVIAEWQTEHDRDVLVGLSCPKDVQDAILADATRAKIVDVIDIRYWTYDKDGQLYAPGGGQNLAPRQHLRQLQPEASSFASIVKAVREYRRRFPEKAVTYSAGDACRSGEDGWAVLMGGGSLANVHLPEDLQRALVAMRPADDRLAADDGWALAAGDEQVLVYFKSRRSPAQVAGLAANAAYRATWIDEQSGEPVATEELAADASGRAALPPHAHACWLQKLD
ncbi:MAG: hypothetical protein KDA44_12830 [Planctomycetales bacterium]|nr:hypothetical protein [Planctomycetales bacterium]